jgi:hypothetical protein
MNFIDIFVFVFLGKRKFGGALKAMLGLIWNDPAVAAGVCEAPRNYCLSCSNHGYRR